MKKLLRRPLILLTVAYCCVLVFLNNRGMWRMPADHPLLAAIGASTAVVCEVRTAPVPKPYGVVFDATMATPVPATIRVTAYEPVPVLVPGDRVTLRGTLRRPSGNVNPGGFDYALYLSRLSVYFIFSADQVTVEGHRPLPWHRDWPLRLRSWTIRSLNALMPPATAAVLIPMLIGDTSPLDPETKKAFMDAGVMHVLVVSGMNVAYCSVIFLWLFRLTGLKRRLAALATIPCIILYVLVTGANPPVVRAGVMAISLILSLALAREPLIYQSLALAAAAILIVDPQSLFTASFQLSFAATLGIIYLYPVFILPFKKISRPFAGIARAAGAVIASSAAAQIAVLPLMAYYFNKLSLIGFISNLAIVPLTGLITIVGTALILAAATARAIAVPLAFVSDGLIQLLMYLVTFFARAPHATAHVATPSLAAIMFYYFFWALLFKPNLRYVLLAGVIVFGGYQAALQYQAKDRVSITFLDAGEGDAIHIAFPGNRHWLIDGGGTPGTDTGLRVVCPYLWARGVRRIDRVFITHPDPAHYGGLAAVLNNFPVKAVVYNPDVSADPAFAALMDTISRQNISATEAWAGDEFHAAGCTMTVLSPSVLGASMDDNCLIMRLTAYGKKIIFTSDASPTAQRALANATGDLSADYLQLPAHGGEPVSALLKKINPGRMISSGLARSETPGSAPARTVTIDLRR